MKQAAIEVVGLSKKYKLGQYGFGSILKDIGSYITSQKDESRYFWALKNVSFAVEKGEALGIVGANGAGKSTLLKILSNVTAPTSGNVSVNGKFGSLIELTAGFHTELTGRENIYLYGSIKGMSKADINRKFNDIVAFSGLADFIDTPIKRYSSGMNARLGFSVSAYTEPEILIIDEVLSVGDLAFQRKCLDYMSNLREVNKTIIFVSHNLSSIRNLCNKVIWLEKGQIKQQGLPAEIIHNYSQSMFSQKEFIKDTSFIGEKTRWGTGEIEITNVEVTNSKNTEVANILVGEGINVRIHFKSKSQVSSPIFWVGIINDSEVKITGSYYNKGRSGTYTISGDGVIECHFKSLVLRPGFYHLMVGIYDEYAQVAYDRIGRACTFEVNNGYLKGYENCDGCGAEGLVDFPHEWKMENISE